MTSTLPHRLPQRPSSARTRPRRRSPRRTSSSTCPRPSTAYVALAARPARHGRALRGEGQPAPRAARARWPRSGAASTWPARPRCGPPRRRRPRRATSSTPTRSSAATDIAEAAALGVRLFVVDSPEETRKVAEAAPGQPGAVPARDVRRAAPTGRCRASTAAPRPRPSRCSASPHELGLDAAGVSFHVGSQQRDPTAWAAPIEASARVFAALRARGLRPRLLDLGGGFPAALRGRLPARRGVRRGHRASPAPAPSAAPRPQTIIEPGRGIVGDAGRWSSSVVAVVRARRRPLGLPRRRRLHRTRRDPRRGDPLPARAPRSTAGPTGPCVLAGPTCDSADVLYEDQMVHAAARARRGRRGAAAVRGRLHHAATPRVGFNGFAPLPTVVRRSVRRCSTSTDRPGGVIVVATRSARWRMSLPWPLLLVLVAGNSRRPLAARPRRRGPDAAVRRRAPG